MSQGPGKIISSTYKQKLLQPMSLRLTERAQSETSRGNSRSGSRNTAEKNTQDATKSSHEIYS